jgi:hypothetical protein
MLVQLDTDISRNIQLNNATAVAQSAAALQVNRKDAS